MCGFAGVIAWDERYRVSRETLAKMSARIAHRGPDGEGTYFSPDAEITPDRPQVALAHRRLAILDPDPRANQPFTDKAGRWLVYNGEIYNFRELRAELSKLQPNYEWRTNCDTEVLLVAYDQWAEKCVEHFNGMFAFAIWDEPKKALFLARDRMGQKPLYLCYLRPSTRRFNPEFFQRGEDAGPLPTAVAFASELGSLTEYAAIDRTMYGSALCQYLQFGFIGFDDTIYQYVAQLAPGRRACISASRCCEDFYWPTDSDWPDEPKRQPLSNEEAVRRTRELVLSSVSKQLVSDVPLGCFLSGGIDSSVVAAAMAKATNQLHTFSISFDDPRYDEGSYAAEMAKHLGAKHETFKVRPDAALDLPKLASVFGQPFGDSSALPTHYLARETRKSVAVALSGDGGDELFGGYDRYRAMAWAQALRRMTTPIPWKILRPLFRRLPGVHPKSSWTRAKRFLCSVGYPARSRYARYLEIFDTDTIVGLMQPLDKWSSFGPLGDGYVGNLFRKSRFGTGGWKYLIRDDVRAAMALDRLVYLPGDLLTKVDRCSMLHGLEVRSPFMDHELVQFGAGLTTDQLLKGGPKRMLREAFSQDLPSWVFKRKKMGFAVPIGDWFRGELRPMLRDHLFAANSFAASHFNRPVVERLVDEHETGRVDHSQRLYALLMLELWWRLQTTNA